MSKSGSQIIWWRGNARDGVGLRLVVGLGQGESVERVGDWVDMRDGEYWMD